MFLTMVDTEKVQEGLGERIGECVLSLMAWGKKGLIKETLSVIADCASDNSVAVETDGEGTQVSAYIESPQ